MKRLTRREFLRVSALSAGAVAVSTGLTGCLSGGSSGDDEGGSPTGSFKHGVASGDPLRDRVLIWTRVTPDADDLREIPLTWEVATDAAFSNLVHNGATTARADSDFTIKVDVLNLQAGQTYYYRFKSSGRTSPAGQTRTLPEGAVSTVTFAVVSCANYPAGYFNVYGEVAKEDNLDAVLHLGDYLYEYDNDGYAAEDAEALGRAIPDSNDTELLTLTDYRRRYALYHTDSQLQTLHARVPFIAVWDDHEVANDAWENGAENHQPSSEGDYADRKMAALQAYFEWMPVRPASEGDQETIYRSFEFGDLVSLYMLDTRLIARDEQLDYSNYIDSGTGNINMAAFETDQKDSNREMIGAEQMNWLRNKVMASGARWQVLGQQVLMGRMLFPAELLVAYQSGDTATIVASLQALVEIKTRIAAGDPSVTDEERARVNTTLPYNLDAWDGYYYEREQILNLMRDEDKNLVVLAGDTHNAWANDLLDASDNPVGVEFATASVSSPGLEQYLQLPAAGVEQAEGALTTLIDELKYSNVSQRGYVRLTLDDTEARADWRFVSTVKDSSYSLDDSRSQSLKTTPATRQIGPVT